MVWIFVGAAVLIIIVEIWQQSRRNKAAKSAAQAAGAIDGVKCKHLAGLGLAEGAECEVWSFPDRLEIREKETGQAFSLALGKVRAIEAKTTQEIKKANRSVLGRAFVGNLLVPGVGAIVGGLTGLDKTKKVNHDCLIINYTDTAGELQGVTFMDDGNILRLRQFAAGVKKLLADLPREAVEL